MKTIIAIVLFTLLAAGSTQKAQRKRVVCYYMGVKRGHHMSLYPEDIDASICTHLMYIHGAIDEDKEEIYLKSNIPKFETGGAGFVPRLVRLKEVNPDLKLILHINRVRYNWLLMEQSTRSNIIQNGIKWLNESGFDGLSLYASTRRPEKERIDDFFCEMKNEFDKFGYILAAEFEEYSFPTTQERDEDIVGKISRCCDHVALHAVMYSGVTHRWTPLSFMKNITNMYIERGLPANKAVFIVPLSGPFLRLEDPLNNDLGAPFFGPGYNDTKSRSAYMIITKELRRMMNDSSLEWTIRRDNETKEPYAFTTTGLWTSYEDRTSIEVKARYVLEKGLGGIAINMLESDDTGNIGEGGRFPITRSIYDTFNRKLSSADSNS